MQAFESDVINFHAVEGAEATPDLRLSAFCGLNGKISTCLRESCTCSNHVNTTFVGTVLQFNDDVADGIIVVLQSIEEFFGGFYHSSGSCLGKGRIEVIVSQAYVVYTHPVVGGFFHYYTDFQPVVGNPGHNFVVSRRSGVSQHLVVVSIEIQAAATVVAEYCRFEQVVSVGDIFDYLIHLAGEVIRTPVFPERHGKVALLIAGNAGIICSCGGAPAQGVGVKGRIDYQIGYNRIGFRGRSKIESVVGNSQSGDLYGRVNFGCIPGCLSCIDGSTEVGGSRSFCVVFSFRSFDSGFQCCVAGNRSIGCRKCGGHFGSCCFQLRFNSGRSCNCSCCICSGIGQLCCNRFFHF